MSTHEIGLIVCPYCGSRHDRSTNADRGESATPNVGDFTVCIDCERVSVFTGTPTLRPTTAKEEKEFARQITVTKAVLRIVKQKLKNPNA